MRTKEIVQNTTEDSRKNAVLEAWQLSIPVFFAYFPLGIIFGLLFCQSGFPWYYAPIISIIVYNGAVQFLALGIMATGGSYLDILLATIFVALRNSFYGIALIKRYNYSFWKKFYLVVLKQWILFYFF